MKKIAILGVGLVLALPLVACQAPVGMLVSLDLAADGRPSRLTFGFDVSASAPPKPTENQR